MAKEINDLILKDGYKYAEDHEWAQKTGETIKIGITDYAQDQLGEIVFVELPEVGRRVRERRRVRHRGIHQGGFRAVHAHGRGRIVAVNEGLWDRSRAGYQRIAL